ncbi:MAG: type II toxin-antitoxin system VapC family toxin [Candidatus Bathyarchaeota archaeon]|nr:type II toxin-antitoxin system VapC family toxin [Candidatus Bathyarchaeota archaeon]
MRFIDSNIFIYVATNHPRFGPTSKNILKRIEQGEEATTSTLVICEVAWVFEAMGRQGDIKPTIEKILSYSTLHIEPFDADDLIVGATIMANHHLDFNDAVNVALMERLAIHEAYTNDEKHLGRLGFIRTIFE